MMKKLSSKYYSKQITTRGNGNFQPHDQEESKLNGTINAKSGAHTVTHEEIFIISNVYYINIYYINDIYYFTY